MQTNLDAVAQTGAEPALHRWPVWPLQDELRRTGIWRRPVRLRRARAPCVNC